MIFRSTTRRETKICCSAHVRSHWNRRISTPSCLLLLSYLKRRALNMLSLKKRTTELLLPAWKMTTGSTFIHFLNKNNYSCMSYWWKKKIAKTKSFNSQISSNKTLLKGSTKSVKHSKDLSYILYLWNSLKYFFLQRAIKHFWYVWQTLSILLYF